MIQVEERIDTTCRPRDVFDYLARVENNPDWNPFVERIERTDVGPVVEGQRFQLQLGKGMLTDKFDTVVQSAATTGYLKFESRGPRATFVEHMGVEKTETGSRVTWRIELEPVGFAQLFELGIEKIIEAAMPHAAESLRATLDQLKS